MKLYNLKNVISIEKFDSKRSDRICFAEPSTSFFGFFKDRGGLRYKGILKECPVYEEENYIIKEVGGENQVWVKSYVKVIFSNDVTKYFYFESERNRDAFFREIKWRIKEGVLIDFNDFL